MKHTDLPWYFNDDKNGAIYVTAETAPLGDICDLYHTDKVNHHGEIFRKGKNVVENATFVVKACNSHYDLLEALIELVDLMQGVIEGDYSPDSFTLQPAKQAIKKATE